MLSDIARAYERMIAKVRDPIPGFCWIFEGALDRYGYGMVRAWIEEEDDEEGHWGTRKAHQVSFVYHRGPIPKTICKRCKTPSDERRGWCEKCGTKLPFMVLRHRCHTPACVNPEHLLPGTQGENIMDMIERGTFMGKQQEPAECPF